MTIAAVDGYAVGGGLEITMACDFVIATRRALWGMPEVDVGLHPGLGWDHADGAADRAADGQGGQLDRSTASGKSCRRARAVEPGGGRDEQLDAEVGGADPRSLLAKNQQALRQLKFIINNGVEADLHTAQGFEALSAGLTGAVNGAWQVADADQPAGIIGFITDGERWRQRRAGSRDFWIDGPVAGGNVSEGAEK